MLPYFGGLTFSMSILRVDGWKGFDAVFAHPPANTQQILHPELYRSSKVPAPLKLDLPEHLPGDGWTLLEENSMGEFGWKEILKQFLDEPRAKKMAAAWDGDTYATYERKGDKHLLLFTRLRLADDSAAARFFAQYSDALDKKYTDRNHFYSQPGFYSFDTRDGGVFLRCSGNECITFEGGDRALLLQWNNKLGWGPLPGEPKAPLASDLKAAD